MKERARWLLAIVLALYAVVLLSAEQPYAEYVYGRVGPGPSYPDDGTVTYLGYLQKNGETDNEILTEDGYSPAQGTNRGYLGEYYWLDWANFNSPSAQAGDTLVILFTGIGVEAANGGSVDSIISGEGIQQFPNATWGAASNPNTPTDLEASIVSPGVVDINWTGTKQGSYRVYRSSIPSGAGNGASDGHYFRLAKDLSQQSYRDSTAPLTLCWYIVVAEDAGNLSGHCDEVSIDAALPVALSFFSARGERDMVVLEWITESEWDNRGFHIYRQEEGSRDFSPVSQELIPGAGSSSSPREYSWVDRKVENGRTYWYQLVSEDLSGHRRTYGPVSAVPIDALPESYQLSQNYPNPFNPQTWISYQLPEQASVAIRIYNVRGQLVSTLVDAEQAAGSYRARWNGRDLNGAAAASGVYFCQMRSGTFSETVKMILLK